MRHFVSLSANEMLFATRLDTFTYQNCTMNESLMRQWEMLKRIPRAPKKVTANEIFTTLDAVGMYTSLRTIQRDLHSLSKAFPLVFDDGKPIGWSWRKDAPTFDLPGMDPHAALTFALVEAQLLKALPTGTTSHLQPWFEQARNVVATSSSSVFNWKNKIRFVSQSMIHHPQEIDPKVQSVVYDCLLKGHQINITYKAISTDAPPKSYPVHPLGLVINEDAIYLLCTIKERTEVSTLMMQRIVSADATDKPIHIPIDFDIDKVAAASFQIKLQNAPFKLILKFNKQEAKRLEEAPISTDQTIAPIDDQWVKVTATVDDTVQMRRWIGSLGPLAIVEKPEFLRSKQISDIHALLTLYSE
jgi:predicted DNA-binding transcriptional regulator YafY